MNKGRRPVWQGLLVILGGLISLCLGYTAHFGMNSYDLYEALFFWATFFVYMIIGGYLLSRGVFGI
jgi:hypothetical protein